MKRRSLGKLLGIEVFSRTRIGSPLQSSIETRGGKAFLQLAALVRAEDLARIVSFADGLYRQGFADGWAAANDQEGKSDVN